MQHQRDPALNEDREEKSESPRSSGHPADIAVGRRIRQRRVNLGLSQTNLGNELGLSFQQIQKYENGSNRVSASALYQIARILRVPVGFFYEMMPQTAPDGDHALDESASARLAYIATSEGEQAIDLFRQLSPATRKHLMGIMSQLAVLPREAAVRGCDHRDKGARKGRSS
jgi:transcriptional regulator with XRE-family HTH domain